MCDGRIAREPSSRRRRASVNPEIDRWLTSATAQIYQAYLDKSTPYTTYRWAGTGVGLLIFFIRIVVAEGWYIVAYSLGIYLLNLFLAFLSPKFDPSMQAAEQDDGLEGAASPLPHTTDDEFRPFIRRLPEFKFWHNASRAVAIAFVCSWFEMFNVPVFWPVLVVYWIILFCLTSEFRRRNQRARRATNRWQCVGRSST